MSDLVLGPVIGKLGGAADPVPIPLTPGVGDRTASLPDGEWLLIVRATRTSVGSSRLTIRAGGEPVAELGLSGHAMLAVRHVSGDVTLDGSGVVTFTDAVAFPDPTS
ncbi:hypothetical protein [Corynebacterium kalidii]|uniref:Uncharacterized protein n=1 Tax=Corynebacterium kalidii TaxID=2931982 RepID=A0A9X1WIN7_9CORY|nr:hypothetical protein [Corynebacterium kalidii]MCJ7859281.1 hypothetical protein [Corynebacterium kalidii]